MTNFAERLVARGAGVPSIPSISVLAPRPVSRFEPTMAIEVETIAESPNAERSTPMPRGTGDSAAEGAAPINSTAVRTSIEAHETQQSAASAETASPVPFGDAVRRPGYEASLTTPAPRTVTAQTPPSDAGQMQPGPTQSEQPLSEHTQYSRVVTMPVADKGVAARDPSPQADPTVVEAPVEIPPRQRSADSGPMHPDRQFLHENIPPPPASDRARDIGRLDLERQAATSVRPAAMIDEGKVEQAPAPVISIGRIEVQFLPQEQRMPAPGPQPPRTRGFDAYARARRGEPR